MPSAEYMRNYRRTPEGQYQAARAKHRARSKERALKRLADEYPEMYRRFLEEELARGDGLTDSP